MPEPPQDEPSSELPAPDFNAETQPLPPEHNSFSAPEGQSPAGSDPSRPFGRYRIRGLLKGGGEGDVYRAIDELLDREVAIKVTKQEQRDPEEQQRFLKSARIVAALDHPNIVPVYHVGEYGPTKAKDFFVVSKLIDGNDLADRIKLNPPDRLLALQIVVQIADALYYAHTKGLVHRDIKPANILIDRRDKPYLTDFGIALRECDPRKQREPIGTPAYMSPEQARGLGHRIDNRSDIYSLGVVLYELLTGRRPFQARNRDELLRLIANEEVRTPRNFDKTIPQELGRICGKALQLKARDRYEVASDFAEDIRIFLTQNAPSPGQRPPTTEPPAEVTPLTPLTPVTPLTPQAGELAAGGSDPPRSRQTAIVPRGLRSFDASDAGFFLELLPGPFDREGLPATLRFWKTRIEQTDPDQTFKVGLIYGPSGCGKSSLVKAGLLPRLNPKIVPVYLEAAADETEARLLRSIKRAIPDAEGNSLPEVLSSVRRRRLVPGGGKLLLVLDQFEQWLFAHPNCAKGSLTSALQECDGSRVQAIVMVRDDFLTAVTRFFRELDLPNPGPEDSTLVDLFSLEHTAKVLGLFGKAYSKLPDDPNEWSEDQREFIQQAVGGLSEDGLVISVRISLLADMLRNKPWTRAALKELGGVQGVGLTFLEEMFGSRHAPVQNRRHQKAVRGLLAALLPAFGADLKGSKRSLAELREAAGYAQQPQEFTELLGILDRNLRLITPVDAEDWNTIVPDRSTLVPNRAEEKKSSAVEAESAGAAEQLGQLLYDRSTLVPKRAEEKKSSGVEAESAGAAEQLGQLLYDRSTLVPNRAEEKKSSAVEAESAGAAEQLGQLLYDRSTLVPNRAEEKKSSAVEAESAGAAKQLGQLLYDRSTLVPNRAEEKKSSGVEAESAGAAEQLGQLLYDRSTLVPNRAEEKKSSAVEAESAGAAEQLGQLLYYQLAHDYLVPSLREWLTRKQRETRKGRAELKLAERTAAWSAVQETKQLPTLGEWLRIRWLTERAKWKPAEQRLMRAASGLHLTRLALAAAACGVLIVAGLMTWQRLEARQADQTAAGMVAKLQAADFSVVPKAVADLAPHRPLANQKLAEALKASPPDSPERLKLSLGLLGHDPAALRYVAERLPLAEAEQVPVLVELLAPYRQELLPQLWERAASREAKTLLPVASALAAYDPQSGQWSEIAAAVSDQLVRENALRVGTWINLLRPAAVKLNPELKEIYASAPGAARSQAQIDLATEMLETYAAGDFSLLHELILSGRPEQFARLFNEYEVFPKEALTQLQDEVARSFVPDSNAAAEEVEQARLRWIARQANAAVALLRLEEPRPVYEFLTVDRDPEALSQFIYRIRGREVSPALLVKSVQELNRLATPADAKERQQHYLRLYGLLLGLGEFSLEQLPSVEREAFRRQLVQMYEEHPSRAVHSATGWLLRRWGQTASVRAIDETPLEYDPSGVREWFVIKIAPPPSEWTESESSAAAAGGETTRIDLAAAIYLTMLVFPGGEYEMGEVGEGETITIAGPIAVSDREVTWRQFSPIDGDDHRQAWERQFEKQLGGRRLLAEEPAFGVSWFDAVNYCRWLTAARMPGEENQSYASKELTAEQRKKPGWVLSIDNPNDWEWPLDMEKPGFRLLTDAEWEYVARGGMETEYSFGSSRALLGEYGWYDDNSGGWSHPTGELRPSVAGLFDVHGNLWEWTNDSFREGSLRVGRGGSWGNEAAGCRAAARDGGRPSDRSNGGGFRVALSSPSGIPRPPEAGADK